MVPSGCWIWQRGVDSNGYSSAWNGSYMDHAHRLIWMEKYGPIPKGEFGRELDLHHLCENKLCVNPDHLALMTALEHHRQHAKLTMDDRAEILALLEMGERQVDIAEWFDVSQVRVSQIKRWDTVQQ